MSGPVRIGDLLRKYGDALGLGPRLAEVEVLAAWSELFGGVSEYRPHAFRSGTLVVAAENSAVAQELSLRREAMREALNRRLGRPVVRRIRVVQGGSEG